MSLAPVKESAGITTMKRNEQTTLLNHDPTYLLVVVYGAVVEDDDAPWAGIWI
jgi:hypothetical protein